MLHFFCQCRLNSPATAVRPAVSVGIWILLLVLRSTSAAADNAVDFNRDVRPILADNCFACHGFDEGSREVGLRLDVREGATEDRGGYAAIMPGDSDASELIVRAIETDPEMRMPPENSHKKPLTANQIGTIRRWIDQGATWGKHWSFESPEKEHVPEGASAPIDYFVHQRFEHFRDSGVVPAGVELAIAPRATTHTLARRLSFDLTGLPPSPDQLIALGEAPTDADWDRWIDQLLRSPHFGERMAMWWLDGARYADTDGFQQDASRENWPWRDWVVDAFNNNMSFDQFTIQQFAGDLMPGATDETRLATCFHRNHMHNGEGGRDPEESRVDYVLDRTNTVGTLWLGLTLGCTQCHDHKFDPISQHDYYSMTAYFDSIDEDGQAGSKAGPFLTYQSDKARLAVEEAEQLVKQTAQSVGDVATEAENTFQLLLLDQIDRASNGFVPWRHVEPAKLWSVEGTSLKLESEHIIRSGNEPTTQDDFHVTVSDPEIDRVTGVRLEVFADDTHTDKKYSHASSGEFVLTNIKLQVRSDRTTEVVDVPLVRAIANVDGVGEDPKYGKVEGTLDDDPRTGWTTRTKEVLPVQTAVFELAQPLTLARAAPRNRFNATFVGTTGVDRPVPPEPDRPTKQCRSFVKKNADAAIGRRHRETRRQIGSAVRRPGYRQRFDRCVAKRLAGGPCAIPGRGRTRSIGAGAVETSQVGGREAESHRAETTGTAERDSHTPSRCVGCSWGAGFARDPACRFAKTS